MKMQVYPAQEQVSIKNLKLEYTILSSAWMILKIIKFIYKY